MTLAFDTALGRCKLVYDASGVRQVTMDPGAKSDKGPYAVRMRALARAIARAARGQPVDFSAAPLSYVGVPPFHAEVYRALLQIPFGVTLSYGELAARAGRPGAARAVGAAMARSKWTLLMPCHRVLASNGSLGGYGGADGLRKKRWLLDREARAGAKR